MDSSLIAVLLPPAFVAGALFVVFTYLYEQSRAAYFRAWQLGWACQCLGYLLLLYGFGGPDSRLVHWAFKVLLAMVPLFIVSSPRLMTTNHFPIRWRDVGLLAVFMAWAAWLVLLEPQRPLQIEVGMAALLLVAASRFWMQGGKLHSLAYRLLSFSLGLWIVLLLGRQFHSLLERAFPNAAHFLGAVPQMMIGIAMIMVLYENERRTVQESLLAFSSLDVDASRILEAAELEPPMLKLLDRMLQPLHSERGALWVADSWRRVLPGAVRGLSPDLLDNLSKTQGAEYLRDLLAGGKEKLSFRHLDQLETGEFTDDRAPRLRELLAEQKIRGLTVVALQTREYHFGLVLAPHNSWNGFGSSQLRLLTAEARQLSMTLENCVLMQDAARRTEEFELLTEIGQVVSSRLDSEEVLRTVHRELSRLFDANTFYIAFMEGDEVRFEFEYDSGQSVAKRTRKATNGLTEHIIRTGEPLLVRYDMEKMRARIGAVRTGNPAKCFCGVPIFMYGRAVGVMAALNYEREFVYEQRDLDVMKTAAGQVAVAMENARLFAEEQRRSKYLEFLNIVSKTAISSQEPEAMMADIVSEIQKNFRFDHIGIGILDYASKDIEIKAEAGTTEKALGRRIPLGVGILGRVARTGEMALAQSAEGGRLLGILPESKSILCVPIVYSESMLGVLNVESRRDNAFAPQEVLILRTLADLLATALHNAFVFQKMQQQSITDGLTGIKTRRFFNEALQSEWKRASRSGRPFSVVLIDLDKFKNVNDTMGHLEGDLVLARIGRILEQKSRSSNVVARYGGDEFVILMPETGVDQAQILSERLRLWIATDTTLNERQVSGSFGVATFPQHGATAEEILRVADVGMYTAKRSGGNRVCTPEDFAKGESTASHRHAVQAHLETFLLREALGPESVEDLVATLERLQSSILEGGADAVMEAVRTLNQAAEAREMAGPGHGEAVAQHAEAIGRELGLAAEELLDLVQAARLHDVGKILVPEPVLNKEEKLSRGDRALIESHPELGARILEIVPGSTRMSNYVRHHHERFDGTGYPQKLRGEDIPLGARIIAVADAFAHITTDRPYAVKRTPAQALAELEKSSGTQFDGMIVRTFTSLMRQAKAAKSEA
ncbi:MAG TPA: diguanylate cyclase [Candidatus Angelobacter sp.]|nr:diguanylate cyclase [Candidatus Angelobacter sp.]